MIISDLIATKFAINESMERVTKLFVAKFDRDYDRKMHCTYHSQFDEPTFSVFNAKEVFFVAISEGRQFTVKYSPSTFMKLEKANHVPSEKFNEAEQICFILLAAITEVELESQLRASNSEAAQ